MVKGIYRKPLSSKILKAIIDSLTPGSKQKAFSPIKISLKTYKLILPTYLAELRNDFNKMKASFHRGNYPEVRQIAHKIKGSSVSFGAQLIREKAFVIEKETPQEQLEEQLNQLSQLIEQTHSEAERLFLNHEP